MADQQIVEAMERVLSLTQQDLAAILPKAFLNPSPPIKASTLNRAIADFNSPAARLQRLVMGEPILEQPPTIKQFQVYHKYPDGTQAGIEIEVPYRPNAKPEHLWENPDHLKTDKLDLLVKAAAKCGIPESKSDLLLQNGKLENAVKTAMTRQAVKSAFINGTWQSATLTAVFDIGRLFDGQFMTYLTNIGVSGLYGGTVGAFSSWVNHPFFGNGVVLGVFVGTAFGTVSLASSGDWTRFGRGLGVNVLGGAASWAGASAGAAAGGALLGPLGAAAGAFIGGIAAGWGGRTAAGQIPGLHGHTDHEVNTMAEAIRQQFADVGMEPDPALSNRQLVEAIMTRGNGGSDGLPFGVRMTDGMASSVTELRNSLQDLRRDSPEAFDNFLQLLQEATSNT